MFILSALDEEIRVQPQDLSKSPLDAVTDVIEQRFLDKVIPNLGLVVTLYDVQSIEGGFIYPNDGAAFFRVKFRVVVFRPYKDEVIVGTLKSCSREGLRIHIDFFDDIIVPEHSLQEPSFYNEAEKVWVWKFDGEQALHAPPCNHGAWACKRANAVSLLSCPVHLLYRCCCTRTVWPARQENANGFCCDCV